MEPSAGIIAITSELPGLLGPVKVVGAGDAWARPTVGITGTAFQNPYAPGGSFCPETDGNIPATVIGTTTSPEAGNGPNVRGEFDPLLQVTDPTVTGTSPTTYGTSDGTAYGTPNGAFGVAADYTGPEPNGHVTIDHLVLENACIGILSLRSHDNTFEHNLLYNDVGTAGVVVTGDAGDATGSSTTGVSINNTTEYNRFVDNGDDMEYTRGTSNGLIKDNVYIEDPEPLGSAANGADTGATNTTGTPGLLQAGDLPSQTIEFAGSGDNNNTVIGNRLLGGMSDGFQNGGTGMVFKDNYITGDAYGIDLDDRGRCTRTTCSPATTPAWTREGRRRTTRSSTTRSTAKARRSRSATPAASAPATPAIAPAFSASDRRPAQRGTGLRRRGSELPGAHRVDNQPRWVG